MIYNKLKFLTFSIFSLLFCNLSSTINLKIYPAPLNPYYILSARLEIMIKTPFSRTITQEESIPVIATGKLSNVEQTLIVDTEAKIGLEIKQFDPTKEKLFYKVKDKFVEFPSTKIEEIKGYSEKKHNNKDSIDVFINLGSSSNEPTSIMIIKFPSLSKITDSIVLGIIILIMARTHRKIKEARRKGDSEILEIIKSSEERKAEELR